MRANPHVAAAVGRCGEIGGARSNISPMFTFTDDERVVLSDKITMDAQGREILVGLTVEETAEYMRHTRQFLTGKRDQKGKKRYLELHNKHEIARLQVLGAEIQLRNDKPTLQ